MENDVLTKVRNVTVGTLWFDTDNDGLVNGAEAAVIANEEVAVADIPKLKFLSALHGNGSPYANFDYEVFDGTAYSAIRYTMSINASAVNDLPTTSNNTVTATEDTAFLASANFPYIDVDADAAKVRLQAASKGTLWVDTDSDGILNNGETAVINNEEVTAANFTKLTYLAVSNESGTTYATFDFEVHDGTAYSAANATMTIDVTAVNDAPVTSGNTVNGFEDTDFVFSVGDFPYTDTESDALIHIRLQAVTKGTLG